MVRDFIDEDDIDVTEQMAAAGAACLLYYEPHTWDDREMVADIYRAMEARKRYEKARTAQGERLPCLIPMRRR